MNEDTKHVAVCICTYKRPALLKRLLEELDAQETDGTFTYSVVGVDNDPAESAKAVVSEFTEAASTPVKYCVEPRQSISRARNRAIQNASGDFVAFIDDDEFPVANWLLTLFRTCDEHEVDGVLGPVKPHFENEPPSWIRKGKFYDRATYPTGFKIDWPKGRTGNVLLKKLIFGGYDEPFREAFVTGEDQDFFRRMIERGYVFIWCDEAVAYEWVPPVRWKRSFMLKRALLRGKVSLRHPTTGAREIAKSVIAVPIYTVALPFTLLAGQHVFMKYLIKLFDHAGRLLAFVKLSPVSDTYVVE